MHIVTLLKLRPSENAFALAHIIIIVCYLIYRIVYHKEDYKIHHSLLSS